MGARLLHRFEHGGKRFVIDPETCFCFECDEISWDVLEHFPEAPVNRVLYLLKDKHPAKELEEVLGELEWLRGSKSILSSLKMEQQQKAFELERGLRRLEISAAKRNTNPSAPASAPAPRGTWFSKKQTPETATDPSLTARVRRAAAVLLARGADGVPLRLDLAGPLGQTNYEALLPVLREAFALARVAGKTLHVALGVTTEGEEALGDALVTYSVVCTRAEHLDPAIGTLRGGSRALPKSFAALPDGANGEASLCPRGKTFAGAVKALHAAGFKAIHLDLDTFYAVTTPVEAANELRACAEFYASALLKADYFRLEPIAAIFNRIYLGTPIRRTDPAGLSLLHVDDAGDIYPSRSFAGHAAHRIGNLDDDSFEPAQLARYEDVGSVTTPACFSCWARNACGGGAAAVHEARTGSFRTPDPDWCEGQRAWLESAIATFNQLSGAGVNFARVYGELGKSTKPSLFTMVKAAFQMNIGLRPLGEADAELLTKWQNFNDAAYFTFNETGLLMATKYDREMDALYPKGYEFEFLLLRKGGEPMGLLRIRPLNTPGTAMAWVYLRNEADYANEGVRKSFRFLLGEAGKQQGLHHLVVPAGPFDAGLASFLAATGFEPTGSQREALFLRSAYHDVTWHGVALNS